jgi:NADH-quinone oxidoreductase subunit G
MTTTTSEPKKDAPAAAAPAAQPAPPSDTVSLTINGQKVTAKKGTLLVEAAKQVGIDIPVFCYHPKLKPVGACRMCLVEIEKMPRLQTACTTPVGEGMVVKTQSELAKGGQAAVISLLLANHPLDCPVCDKGGECPLQDNTFGYGPGVSKFEEEKRHNEKAFELSDKIVLDRERCILCYRCVRFHEEIPGDRALAVIDRGGHGEIGVLAGETYDSPFQGNTIDICPVGALTSRQYRFRSRPWDLKTQASIACDDPVGSNIDVDTRDGRVLRVRPRENLEVNDAWISDRTRFGTVPVERAQRIGQPLVRDAQGKLQKATWEEALTKAATMIRRGKTGWIASPTVTNEALGVLAQMAKGDRGGDVGVSPAVSPWPVKGSLASIAKSKSIVVVGMDPWTEIPMLALWIHRACALTAAGPGGATLVVVNDKNGLYRDTKHWVKASGAELKSKLKALVDDVEKGAGIGADLKNRPTTLLIGDELAGDPEARPLLEKLAKLLEADGTGGLVGAPSEHVNGRGAYEIFGEKASVDPLHGVLERAMSGELDTLVVLGNPAATEAVGKNRVIWLAHSLTSETEIPGHVDVLLPLAHPYEQQGSFTNLEGRAQGFEAAGVPPGPLGNGALADWAALVKLSGELGAPLPSDIRALREHLAKDNALFARIPKTSKARLSIV